MIKKPELLAPLHNWKSLSEELKVLENADAVYFGITGNFCTRALGDHFPVEDVPELVQLIHNAKKKCYLATNVIVYNDELLEIHQTLELAKKVGVDAIICNDMATMMIAKQMNLPFHVSTQMSVSNKLAAKFYESLGASRVVLARELDLEQIKDIITNVNVGIECFIHGAMCTAISGRCYLSAELTKFDKEYSANHGKCTQPCRRTFTFCSDDDQKIDYDIATGLFFNSKDLCMIGFIPELINAKIECFKIEGRMRDPLYIQETTACYREAIDACLNGTYTKEKIQAWMVRLRKVFNRGFHTGFYFNRPGIDEIEFKQRGNLAEWKKTLVGKVTNFYSKIGVAEVELSHGQLKLGDDLIFENVADFFHRQIIESMHYNKEPCQQSPLASPEKPILLSIKTTHAVPWNASVYLNEDISQKNSNVTLKNAIKETEDDNNQ